MNLADFLLARIAEDETAARAALQRGSTVYDWAVLRDRHFILADSHHIPRWKPARVIAECDAKRRIVTDVGVVVLDPFGVQWPEGYKEALEHTLRLLALPYADHPDYDEAWRP